MKPASKKHTLAGLKPFDEADAEYYYIEETLTEKFFRYLKKNRFVLLTGEPGCGKTSFINCAVLTGSHLNHTERWIGAKFRPGRSPIKNLARALDVAQATNAKQNAALAIEALLHASSSALTEVFEEYPLPHNTNFLLIVDHFEDIFLSDRSQTATSKAAAAAEAQKLINLLWAFEHHNTRAVYVVVSFSDHYRDRAAEHPKLLDLLQKRSFPFEGISVQETDAVIDRAIPGIWKGHRDISLIKKATRQRLDEDQERHTLTPAWRYLLNHSLQYTFALWLRAYQSIQKKIAGDPSLKEVADHKYLPLLVNDLLRDELSVVNATASKRGNSLWLTLSTQQQQALTRLVKTARETDKKLTLQGYHQVAGKLARSLALEVEEIFYANAKMETVCELFVKTLTSRDGTLEPLRYKTMITCLVGKKGITRQDVNRFITCFGDDGLGLVQVIPSSRIEESLNMIHNGAHIDDDAVVSIRNVSLAGTFPKVTLWIKQESDCIQEYLLYAQAAAGKTASHPLTLERYANTILSGEPIDSCEYSRVIDSFLQKDSTWAALHTPPGSGFASFDRTRKFVEQGVNHWRDINKAEKTRQQEEKKIKRIKRNLFVSAFVGVALVALYTSFSIAQHRMLKQFDCMYDDCLRVSKEINLQYIDKGEDYKALVDGWTTALVEKSNLVDNCIDSMYSSNVVNFIWRYRHWQRRRDALFVDSTRMNVLRDVIDTNFLYKAGSAIEIVEGYKIFDEDLLPQNVPYIVDCRKCDEPGWFGFK